MTPLLALFTLLCGAGGGLLFGLIASWAVRRWDFPNAFNYGLGHRRQRIQEKIVLSAMVLGGLLFAAVVSMPAWGIVEVDANLDELADDLFTLDLVRFILILLALVAIGMAWARAWGNRGERRKSGTEGKSDRGDILLKIATKEDLQTRFEHLETSLRRALNNHDEKNDRDFSALREDIADMRTHIDKMAEASNRQRAELEKRVEHLERAAKGDSNR